MPEVRWSHLLTQTFGIAELSSSDEKLWFKEINKALKTPTNNTELVCAIRYKNQESSGDRPWKVDINHVTKWVRQWRRCQT